MKIIFVRHGQTTWNLQGRLQGQMDIPLNNLGVIQTNLLCSKLKEEKIDLIFSSPLERALNTALPISNCYDMGVLCTSLLSERNFGILEGIKLKEIDKDINKKNILKKTRDPLYKPEAGESLKDLQERIFKFLFFLKEFDSSLRILCVTHGGILDLIYRHANNKPINTPRTWLIPNTSISIFDYQNEKLLLKSWADTSHLKNLSFVDEI